MQVLLPQIFTPGVDWNDPESEPVYFCTLYSLNVYIFYYFIFIFIIIIVLLFAIFQAWLTGKLQGPRAHEGQCPRNYVRRLTVAPFSSFFFIYLYFYYYLWKYSLVKNFRPKNHSNIFSINFKSALGSRVGDF